MKVACLVMAYRAAPVLARCLPLYRDAGWDVFVHLDAKVDLAGYAGTLGPSAALCRFVPDPVEVFWAGFSMVEAEFRLLRMAQAQGTYDRLVLVNDDTFPIFPPGAMNARLAPDRDLITAVYQPPGSPNALLYEKFQFADHRLTAFRAEGPRTAEIDPAMEAAVAGIAALRRIGKKPVALHYGAPYWSLRPGTVAAALSACDSDAHLLQSFRYTSHADELLLQTVIAAQQYPRGIATGPVHMNFTSVHGHAKAHECIDDLPFDLHPHHLFVRKISPSASIFLDRMQGRLRAGRTIHGADPEGVMAPCWPWQTGREQTALTVALTAPPEAESAPALWCAPEAYLRRPFRWTAARQVHWQVNPGRTAPGRICFHVPVLMGKPGTLQSAELTFGGRTQKMAYSRYSLTAAFEHDGLDGPQQVILHTPPPVPADPPRDGRLVGIGVAI